MLGNIFSALVAAAFVCYVVGTLVGGFVLLIIFIIAELRWPNTYRKTNSPGSFGLYIRPTLGKEKEGHERDEWLGNAFSLTIKICFTVAGIATVVLAIYQLSTKGLF